jgi:hypothetical protein
LTTDVDGTLRDFPRPRLFVVAIFFFISAIANILAHVGHDFGSGPDLFDVSVFLGIAYLGVGLFLSGVWIVWVLVDGLRGKLALSRRNLRAVLLLVAVALAASLFSTPVAVIPLGVYPGGNASLSRYLLFTAVAFDALFYVLWRWRYKYLAFVLIFTAIYAWGWLLPGIHFAQFWTMCLRFVPPLLLFLPMRRKSRFRAFLYWLLAVSSVLAAIAVLSIYLWAFLPIFVLVWDFLLPVYFAALAEFMSSRASP